MQSMPLRKRAQSPTISTHKLEHRSIPDAQGEDVAPQELRANQAVKRPAVA